MKILNKMKLILKKISKPIRKNKLYCLTFLIGLAVIGIIFKMNNTIPFGDNSLLCVDFYHQYGPMMAELYDRIWQGESFVYSFNMAMGLPFFRNFMNYLSSPFNILMLLFNRENLLTSYSFIIGLKAVMSCVTFVYFISKKFNKKDLTLIPLGLLYGFSSYFTAYYWNIMWLDGMVWVPIITLGIENIINTGKWKLYTFSLAIMLISNYFIGYMICIYAVIYFLGYLFYKTKFKWGEIKKNLKQAVVTCCKFGGASLLGGMLSFFLLIPQATSMLSISATGDTMPSTQYYAFEVIDYLKAHFSGVEATVFASDEITNPNISTGILSIALVMCFILNLNIKLKNKIAYLLILGFFIAAFFIPQLDFIMHAFHVPNDLPYRYSFLYSFVFLTMATYGLINIKKMKYPFVAAVYVLLMVLLLVISKDNWAGMTTNMVYINMILLTLYFIFYTALHFMDNLDLLFKGALVIVAAIDVIVSVSYNWDISQVRDTFYEDYTATEKLLDYVKDYDDEEFYRIENTTMMTLNDGSWYDYYGMTTFSSMAYQDLAELQSALGMPGNMINSYYYVHSTPIYDLMFDIKYFIGQQNDFNRYQTIYTDEESAVEFNYNVGLGFGVNKDIANWHFAGMNPFDIQNDFMIKSTGVYGTLYPATLATTTEIFNDGNYTILKYEFENTHDNMYFYSGDYSVDFVLVGETLYYKNDNYLNYTSYSDELTYYYIDDYSENRVINIHSGEDKIVFYVGYNTYYSQGFDVYNIDNVLFNEAYNILNKKRLDITNFEEDYIEGNITLEEDDVVYTSIPYDKGWKVYVDGEKVETFALANSLLCFDAPAGTHKITFKYVIPGFALGLTISSLSTLGILIGSIYGDKIKKYFDNQLNKLSLKIIKKREQKKGKKK